MSYFKHGINRAVILLALLSFIMGSLLFLLYLVTQSSLLIAFGILFVFLSAGSNFIFLLILLMNMIVYYKNFQEHFTAMMILLINVPILGLYLFYITTF